MSVSPRCELGQLAETMACLGNAELLDALILKMPASIARWLLCLDLFAC